MKFNTEKISAWLLYLVIASGLLLRTIIYGRNRNLIVDEANVVRNIFERDYAGLFQPLDYQQFAPKIFLSGVKTCSLLFGFSEYSLRLIPFVASLLSVWLLCLALKKVAGNFAAIYPLLLFCSGLIFIRYGTEMKQYSSDIAINLALILLTLNTSILKETGRKFFLIWAAAGSVAVWTSMPSVFILAGIGCYYLYQAVRENKWKLPLLTGLGAVWAGQFVLYYLLILSKEINSEYLQNWHRNYFITLIPENAGQAQHNLDLCLDVLVWCGGDMVAGIAFNLLLLLAGAIYLARKKTAQFLLFAVPVVALLSASAMHQFTLLPRVVLFIMPVMLLLMGAGFQALWQVRYSAVKFVLAGLAIVCVVNFNQFRHIIKPFENEEFTQGMAIARREHTAGSRFHVTQLIVPVYIYYLQIHPRRDDWSDFKDAHLMTWETNYDSLLQHIEGRHSMLYTWYMEDVLQKEMETNRKYCKSVIDLHFPGGTVYILSK